jgi:hypothetical protein
MTTPSHLVAFTVSSATKMSGTVTGTSDKPRKWSAEKKK